MARFPGWAGAVVSRAFHPRSGGAFKTNKSRAGTSFGYRPPPALSEIRRHLIGVVEVCSQSLSVWLLRKGEGRLRGYEQKGAGCGHFHCQMLKFDNENGKRTGPFATFTVKLQHLTVKVAANRSVCHFHCQTSASDNESGREPARLPLSLSNFSI